MLLYALKEPGGGGVTRVYMEGHRAGSGGGSGGSNPFQIILQWTMLVVKDHLRLNLYSLCAWSAESWSYRARVWLY